MNEHTDHRKVHFHEGLIKNCTRTPENFRILLNVNYINHALKELQEQVFTTRNVTQKSVRNPYTFRHKTDHG